MTSHKRVVYAFLIVGALSICIVSCATGSRVAAVPETEELAPQSGPSGSMPHASHDLIHRVIEFWLDRKEDEAQELIGNSVVEDRSMGVETRAALHNLSARILWANANQGIGGRERIVILERAEHLAALAVRAVPMNFSFWRDYVSLAVAARGRSRVRLRLTGVWRYQGHVPTMHMFQTDEQLAIGRAILHMIEGRDGAAISHLQSFLASQRGDACSARAVLSQMFHDVGQIDAATETIAGSSSNCRQEPFVARFESVLAAAKEAREVQTSDTIVAEVELPKLITIVGDLPDDHRADLENSILQNPARLDRWYALWKMLHEFGDVRRVREYQKVVDLARRIHPSIDVDLADVHGQLGRGELRNAFEMATGLLEKHRNDPMLHAVRLLCGAALGEGVSACRQDLDAVDRQASITSCLRQEQVEYCLGRDPRCVRGAMVRRRADQFSAAAYRRGWPIHSPTDVAAYVEWTADEEKAERLDGMTRLHDEMVEKQKRDDEKIAALYARVDLIVLPKLNELQAQVDEGVIDVAELKAEMSRARAQTNAELKQLARKIDQGISIMHRESALTREQVRALAMRVAADYQALLAIDINRFSALFERYIDTRPREAIIFHFNIMNQVKTAKAADNDVASMATDIADECMRKQAPSAPCLRAVLRIVKKHFNAQIPLLPIPGILSLDVLGIGDSVLELWDYLNRKFELVPDGKRFDMAAELEPRHVTAELCGGVLATRHWAE